jgi:hypothetical protein
MAFLIKFLDIPSLGLLTSTLSARCSDKAQTRRVLYILSNEYSPFESSKSLSNPNSPVQSLQKDTSYQKEPCTERFARH